MLTDVPRSMNYFTAKHRKSGKQNSAAPLTHWRFAGRTIAFFIICLFLALCSKKKDNNNSTNNPPTLDADVTILANNTNQVIEGFGCATVFSPPNTTALTSDEFDRLFGSGNGQIGLNILRIRIASDAPWRATELSNAKAAIQRGAKVIATPWSPPANMKTNNNIIRKETKKKLSILLNKD